MKALTPRTCIGALVHDWPRFAWCLRPTIASRPESAPWIWMRNRQDQLLPGPDRIGAACGWEFTRTLHLCDLFPRTGRRLLYRALRDWPIGFSAAPDHVTSGGVCANGETSPGDAFPEVSFLIGHRGVERVPQLLLTLKSIAVQASVRFECIVVEQDVTPQTRSHLPDWVRYVHDPIGDPHTPYCRSRAFNAGAASARGRLLVLHDNDLLVPDRYAESAWKLAGDGYEVINLKRFIFYGSEGIQAGQSPVFCGGHGKVKSVLENATGGGSLGCRARGVRGHWPHG